MGKYDSIPRSPTTSWTGCSSRTHLRGEAAVRTFPAGKPSPVVIDPRVSSAAATVRGVRTAILAERAETFGETPEELAEEFELSAGDVKAAIAFEYAA